MRIRNWTPWLVRFSITLANPSDNPQSLTRKHEAGRCALRGNCEHPFFGVGRPCPDNGLAEAPNEDVRGQLVDICGEEWARVDKVCCTNEQLDTLQANLKRANTIIGACPACRKNFYDLFCTFTCSPDQSLFVNVTKVVETSGGWTVDQLDQLVGEEYGEGFYDSCKDVKFGATGGKAMDLIGNGAKNYSELLSYLGGKKPLLGSPFQMDFPDPKSTKFGQSGMQVVLDDPKSCNSPDERWKCACVDCPSSCPKPPAIEQADECYIGLLPCLSFAVIIVYSVFIALLVVAVSGHVAAQKRRKSKNERLQLLQDSSLNDDDDDVMHSTGGLMDRPTRQYVLNTWCDRAFSTLGKTCARFPGITIGSSIFIVAFLSLGWLRFQIETDPVKLWVAPNSAAAQEKEFFDNNFGPFFRAEQTFLVNDTQPSGPGPVLSFETLQWWFDVERRVRALKSWPSGYTFQDVCYKPTGEACVVQSVTGYGKFANDFAPESWKGNLEYCTKNFGDPECLPEFQQPLSVARLLGGYNATTDSVLDAEALIVTWVVQNFNPGDPALPRAEEWESSLKGLLLDVKEEAFERGLRLSFTTESSLEEELNKNTNTDAKIVVLSYVVMFIYASLALGSTTVTIDSILRDPASALVQSKFMLGVVGILIVLMSVAASVGLFAAAGVKATLIIAEVIPFLILAVGVDNIFLIVHEFERVNISHADERVSDRIGRALGRMGPSILLSASTETVAFALGAAVGMPAVRNFAAYAAGAVFINACLQVTMFVSILALNQERVEAGRLDCVPCVQIGTTNSNMPSGYGGAPFSGIEEEGSLGRFIRKYYAPALLGTKTRVGIMTVFLGFFAAGIALLPEVQLGLDQRIAIPTDSYLIKYFDDLYDYFDAGPPVYFVSRGLNATQTQHQRELCARFSTCKDMSVANVLEMERKRPDVSFISDPTASWIDDFFQWLNPVNEECCVDPHGEPCFAHRQPAWDPTLRGMPEGEEFLHYLHRWLEAPTDETCPLGGRAPYSNAVVIDDDAATIAASHFRTAHTPLTSQADFIDAYAAARRIAADLRSRHGIDIFPYSKFYIFFDQYATIVRLATSLVCAGLAFILATTTLLLGSLATALVLTLTVTMIVVDVVATISLAGVSLNAVSLVNIIISLGLAVEFCAHLARAYTVPAPALLDRAPARCTPRAARAWAALVHVGPAVFTGITLTKLLGVAVLAQTRSRIFEIYYFRVWLALVLWAAAHALVFLPVALSLFGGVGESPLILCNACVVAEPLMSARAGYVDPESEGGLEQDLARRRYRALLPEEYDSDDD